MKMTRRIDTVGGERLRLQLRYDTIIDMVFELMEEIKNKADIEKTRELENLNKQARELDGLINPVISPKLSDRTRIRVNPLLYKQI